MSAETESSASSAPNLEKCSVVLLDVAGTTTSINFVKDTLFPYVSEKAEEFLKSHWEDDAVKGSVKLLKDSELTLTDAVATVKELTTQNNDNKGLKTIQGLIYKDGYTSGDLKAHVFSDVPVSFEAWAKTKKIAIYSTGSVESQQLLFSHTTEGDISLHINKYFDQNVGNKTESQSYENIAKELNVEKEEVLFVTDNVEEATAAKSSGVLTILVNREGNESFPKETTKEFQVISSFKDITFENPAKRKNEEETVHAEEQPPSKIAKKELSEEISHVAETSIATESLPIKEAPIDSTVEPQAAEAKTEDEKMDVDISDEKGPQPNEEKLAETVKKPTENETEIVSSENKTEKKSDSTNKKEEEPKEITVTDETSMETSDSIDDTRKEHNNKQTKAEKEDNKSEDSEVKAETSVTKVVESTKTKLDQIEKMESEVDSTKISNDKEITENTVVSEKIQQKVTSSTEEVDSVAEKMCETKDTSVKDVEEKIISPSEIKKTDKCVSEENVKEIKETVNNEADVTETEIKTVCKKNETNETDIKAKEDIIEGNKNEVAGEEDVSKSIEKSVKDNETTVNKEENLVEVKTIEEIKSEVEVNTKKYNESKTTVDRGENPEVKPIEEIESEVEKNTKKNNESKSGESTSKVDNLEQKEKEKAEVMPSSNESCSNKEKSNETVTQEGNNETSPEIESKDGKRTEEKENKSELANGVENGKTESDETVHGESEQKQNDDTNIDDAENSVEDIKVKKIDDSADSTPPVSVEV